MECGIPYFKVIVSFLPIVKHLEIKAHSVLSGGARSHLEGQNKSIRIIVVELVSIFGFYRQPRIIFESLNFHDHWGGGIAESQESPFNFGNFSLTLSC